MKNGISTHSIILTNLSSNSTITQLDTPMIIQTNQWIVCPKCKKHIPDISLFLKEHQAQIKVRCPCSSKKQIIGINDYLIFLQKPSKELPKKCSLKEHNNALATNYCVECKKWQCNICSINHKALFMNHITSMHELMIQPCCIEHRKNKTMYYCSQCHRGICNQCQKTSHKRHIIKTIKGLYDDTSINLLYDSFNQHIKRAEQSNLKIKAEIIQRIQEYIVKLNEYIDLIIKEHEKNKVINQQLQDLIALMFSNYKLAQHQYSNYSLIKNVIWNTYFNLDKCQISSDTPYSSNTEMEKDIHSILGYFRSNYIVHLLPSGSRYECAKEIKVEPNYPNSLCQLKDGRLISACSYDHLIKLWDIYSYKLLDKLTGHFHSVKTILQLSNGNFISGSFDSSIKIWDLNMNKCIETLHEHTGPIDCLVELSNGTFVSSSSDRTIKIWSVSNKKSLKSFNLNTSCAITMHALNDDKLATGNNDNAIYIWNMKEGTPLAKMKGHKDYVLTLVLLKDGRLVSGSKDQTLRLWDVSTYQCLITLKAHNNNITKLIQLFDGRVVSCSTDKTLKIWNTTHMNCECTIEGHNDSITSIIQLKDGRLVSGSYDKTIKFWILN